MVHLAARRSGRGCLRADTFHHSAGGGEARIKERRIGDEGNVNFGELCGSDSGRGKSEGDDGDVVFLAEALGGVGDGGGGLSAEAAGAVEAEELA